MYKFWMVLFPHTFGMHHSVDYSMCGVDSTATAQMLHFKHGSFCNIRLQCI